MTEDIEKPRIALLSSSFPPLSYGGISSSNFNLYNALKDSYYTKVFTYCDSANYHEEDDKNIKRFKLTPLITKSIHHGTMAYFRLMGVKGVIYQFRDALWGAISGINVYRAVRKFAPDIVIVPDHGPVSAFWPVLPKSKIIYVSHHNSMRFHKEPLLGEHSEKDARLGRFLEQRAINKADAVVCPSHYMRKVFQETYTFSGPVEVIANTVDGRVMEDIAAAPMHSILGMSSHSPIIYIPSAGSLFKGSQFVLELIRRIVQGYPHEIGFYLSGALNCQFRAHLGYLPVNIKIYCPGSVPYNVNIANIKACALCVSPTLVESFGMALLEAEWNGIPVIAFDVGGNCDVVKNGITGFLVDFPDVDSMVYKSVEFLNSLGESSSISLSTMQYARKQFDQELVLEKYRRLFERITIKPELQRFADEKYK